MYEVGFSMGFSATHSLRGNFGPACRLHGHDYRVDVTVFGDTLTNEGVLIDVTILQDGLHAIVGPWDGGSLDAEPALQGVNTTVEALARFIHEALRVRLAGSGARHMNVRIWESASAWGAFQGEI